MDKMKWRIKKFTIGLILLLLLLYIIPFVSQAIFGILYRSFNHFFFSISNIRDSPNTIENILLVLLGVILVSVFIIIGKKIYSKYRESAGLLPMTFRHRSFVVFFIFLLLFGSAISIDWLTLSNEDWDNGKYEYTVELNQDGRLPEPFASTERRMFILLIDSFRYQTASDPELMPNLDEFKKNSTYGYMQSSVDAVTAPALKVIFTGVDRFSIFAAAQNWMQGDVKVRSILTQLSEANVTISCYSDYVFRQFGNDITNYHEMYYKGPVEWAKLERKAVQSAYKDYMDREHDIVIMHLLQPHHIAQSEGIKTDNYRKAFQEADNVIKMVDAAIPEDEYLIVMGDHGHDETGRHSFGLDVPTFFSIRGPGFKKNHEEKIMLTDVRYFMSWAMGLPLPDNYNSGKYPTALVSRGELPPEYADEYHPLENPKTTINGVPNENIPAFIVTVIYLSLLISIFLILLLMHQDLKSIPIWNKCIILLSPVPLFFPHYRFLSGLIGLLLAGFIIYKMINYNTLKWKRLSYVFIIVLGTFTFIGWGYFLIMIRPLVHASPFAHNDYMYLLWPIMAVIGLIITKSRGPQITAWMCLFIHFSFFTPRYIVMDGWESWARRCCGGLFFISGLTYTQTGRTGRK